LVFFFSKKKEEGKQKKMSLIHLAEVLAGKKYGVAKAAEMKESTAPLHMSRPKPQLTCRKSWQISWPIKEC
jgi:hypothetical protein